MNLSVSLENIFDLTTDSSSPSDIQAALESQFKSNLMIRGYDSWNVPLHKSLNCMPPLAQSTGLAGPAISQEISSIHSLTSSDFVLTASSSDAAVNIWVTKAGLKRIHTLNFKRQAEISPGNSLSRAKLHFLDFECEEKCEGVKVYAPNVEQKAALAAAVVAVAVASSEPGADPSEGEYMQALFDEDEAARLAGKGHDD